MEAVLIHGFYNDTSLSSVLIHSASEVAKALVQEQRIDSFQRMTPVFARTENQRFARIEVEALNRRMVAAVETICRSDVSVRSMPSLIRITSENQDAVAAFKMTERIAEEHEMRPNLADLDVLVTLCLTAPEERRRRNLNQYWHPWVKWTFFRDTLSE